MVKNMQSHHPTGLMSWAKPNAPAGDGEKNTAERTTLPNKRAICDGIIIAANSTMNKGKIETLIMQQTMKSATCSGFQMTQMEDTEHLWPDIKTSFLASQFHSESESLTQHLSLIKQHHENADQASVVHQQSIIQGFKARNIYKPTDWSQ